MMKFVVDTNIVFSAILNSSRQIGKILLSSKPHFQFYSCNFLRSELVKHHDRLLKLTKLSPNELEELEFLVTENITFINEGLLPRETIQSAEILVRDIDPDDSLFIALTTQLKAKLWTGDKELLHGLLRKNFKDVVTTSQLAEILDILERK